VKNDRIETMKVPRYISEVVIREVLAESICP
jgi:hypothetical protein